MSSDQEYGSFKRFEKRDMTEKYGFKQSGFVALENIKKGEAIHRCDPKICDYLQLDEIHKGYTRDEMLEMRKIDQKTDQFIEWYSYMIDDDKYDTPRGWREYALQENCVFYNHCCDGNCGFGSLDSGTIIAVKDIEAGEELTYDYQLMDVEPTMYNIQNCKCCSNRCRGRIDFSTYRQIDWQLEKYEYAGYFIKKRIDDLKTKWYSSRCYLKYNKEKTQLGLASLRQLNKDELVAIYFDKENVNQDSHYIRQAVNGSDANLYLDKNGHCYAKHAIEANTFLTLDFNIL